MYKLPGVSFVLYVPIIPNPYGVQVKSTHLRLLQKKLSVFVCISWKVMIHCLKATTTCHTQTQTHTHSLTHTPRSQRFNTMRHRGHVLGQLAVDQWMLVMCCWQQQEDGVKKNIISCSLNKQQRNPFKRHFSVFITSHSSAPSSPDSREVLGGGWFSS